MDRCDQERLLSGLLDGELSEAEERRVRAHLQQCARCREVLDQLKVVQRGLAAVPLPTEADWQRRWKVVAESLGLREAAQGGPASEAEAIPPMRTVGTVLRWWLRQSRSRWALAVAACLVVLLATLWSLSPPRPSGTPTATPPGPPEAGWSAVELASADSVEVEIEPGEGGPGAMLVLSPDGEVAVLWVAGGSSEPGIPDI